MGKKKDKNLSQTVNDLEKCVNVLVSKKNAEITAAYNRGLSDGESDDTKNAYERAQINLWDSLKYYAGMSSRDRYRVFGHFSDERIFNSLTPQMFNAKIQARKLEDIIPQLPDNTIIIDEVT